jgi:hypothetical protein
MSFIHNSIAISDQLYVWKYKEAICVFKVGVFVYVFPRPERNTRERRIPKRDGNQVNEYMSMVRKNMNSSINQPSTQFDGRHMI